MIENLQEVMSFSLGQVQLHGATKNKQLHHCLHAKQNIEQQKK